VLGIDGKPLVVAPTRLSGITMISREAWSDGGLNITSQVQQALRDRFSAVVDRDLLSGSGEGAVPRGLIGQAQQVTGADLWAATVTGKAQIAASGGTATHLAADPDLVAAEESRVDEDGRPLWPDGLATFAGVQVVPTAGATEPLLYDAQRVLLVVRSDYEALLSEDYGPAFERYAVALRLTARMAAAEFPQKRGRLGPWGNADRRSGRRRCACCVARLGRRGSATASPCPVRPSPSRRRGSTSGTGRRGSG
jgi:HK97 family phage major capsid protein